MTINILDSYPVHTNHFMEVQWPTRSLWMELIVLIVFIVHIQYMQHIVDTIIHSAAICVCVCVLDG